MFDPAKANLNVLAAPSGAGKTTLLQLLAGPMRPTCGKLDRRGRVSAILELGSGFHRDLTGQGIAHTYEEFDGEHNWDYWSVHVKDTLRFFNGLF